MPGPFPAQLMQSIAANDVLAAMITPAVLISASGTLALSTSNRLGRVVDRVRDLSREIEKITLPDAAGDGASPPELMAKRSLIGAQLDCLARRIGYLQTALTAVYTAIGLLVASSVTIGLRNALQLMPDWIPIALGLCGAISLFGASVLLVRETRLAVAQSLLEMAHLDKIMKAKLGEALNFDPSWRGRL